jgi:hypothetical protein
MGVARNASCGNGHCYPVAVPSRKPPRDDVTDALVALSAALDENATAAERIRRRAEHVLEARARGLAYSEIITAEDRPLIVELVSDTLQRLFDAGSRLRRAEAAALHREGVSMERIGEIFGVTRQRVSALLKPRGDAGSRRI